MLSIITPHKSSLNTTQVNMQDCTQIAPNPNVVVDSMFYGLHKCDTQGRQNCNTCCNTGGWQGYHIILKVITVYSTITTTNYARTCTCTRNCMHVSTLNAHMHKRTCKHACTCTFTCRHPHAHEHAHTQARMHTHTHHYPLHPTHTTPFFPPPTLLLFLSPNYFPKCRALDQLCADVTSHNATMTCFSLYYVKVHMFQKKTLSSLSSS